MGTEGNGVSIRYDMPGVIQPLRLLQQSTATCDTLEIATSGTVQELAAMGGAWDAIASLCGQICSQLGNLL